MARSSAQSAEILVSTLGIEENFDHYVKYVNNMRSRASGNKIKTRSEELIKAGHDYETVVTGKRGKIVIYDGFVFRNYKSRNASSVTYWKCNSDRCPARARILADGQLLITISAHNHPPEAEKMADHRVKTLLKTAAMDLMQPLVEIFAEFNVTDSITKRFLRHIRSLAEKNFTPLAVETEPSLEIPSDMMELTVSDLNVPPLCFPTPTLEEFSQSLGESDEPKTSAPTLSDLTEFNSIDELIKRFSD